MSSNLVDLDGFFGGDLTFEAVRIALVPVVADAALVVVDSPDAELSEPTDNFACVVSIPVPIHI